MNNTQQRRHITPAAIVALASGNFGNFLAASTPGGIEAQEKAGQLAQAELQTLPNEMRDARPQFEKLGFVFGEKIDHLFTEVKFPPGWKKVPTSHDMWTDLVDAKGRKRGGIFYKAAFYDQRAHVHLSARFSYGTSPWVKDSVHESVRVTDACGESPFSIDGIPTVSASMCDSDKRAAWAQGDEAKAKCEAWLKANYPDYRNPLAYWPE